MPPGGFFFEKSGRRAFTQGRLLLVYNGIRANNALLS